MTTTDNKTDNEQPGDNVKATETAGLTDYYCPFCGQKLFRGKVATFNMVCSNCNKLVRSQEDYALKDENPL